MDITIVPFPLNRADNMPSAEAYDYYGKTWMKSAFANTTLTFLDVGM